VRQSPAGEQDEIARMILALLGRGGGSDDLEPVPLTADERAAIARSKAEAARGDFATEEEVRAVWAKHRPAPRHPPFTATSTAAG
jgi:hypothetical protein